jgi:hypothetical protein
MHVALISRSIGTCIERGGLYIVAHAQNYCWCMHRKQLKSAYRRCMYRKRVNSSARVSWTTVVHVPARISRTFGAWNMNIARVSRRKQDPIYVFLKETAGRTVSFLGVFVSNSRYSVFARERAED